MKKISLILLSAIATVQVAQATPGLFNGFYVGGQLGWTQRKDKTDVQGFNYTETAITYKQSALNKNKKTNGLIYGIFAGYGQNNNGFYFGGELSIQHDNASKEATYDLAPTATNAAGVVTATGTGKFKTKYERGVVFGFTPRLGAVIAHQNLIYVKLGLEYSRDKVKTDFNYQVGAEAEKGNGSKTKNQFVFVPGIGYERAFGKVLARLEYGYNTGGKISEGKNSIKYTAHEMKAGVAYKF